MPDTPHDRAVAVLRSNKYLVLATADDDGPWAAALAFTLVAPRALCFASQTSSRHARAIINNADVAGVIFDSHAGPEDVESIQFAGTAVVATDPARVRAILSVAGEPDDAEIAKFTTDASVAMYEVHVESSYVLDQAAWEERGVDAREPVDFDAVVAALSAP